MYRPHSRKYCDNAYTQPWKVGDIVWFIETGYLQQAQVYHIETYANRRDRRNGYKFYWIGPVNPKGPTKTMWGEYKYWRRATFIYSGHGLYGEDLYHTKEIALKCFNI